MGTTKRTTMRLTDERQRLLEQAKAIVAAGPSDDPPNSDVIDAALTHLVESQENFETARDHLDPAPSRHTVPARRQESSFLNPVRYPGRKK